MNESIEKLQREARGLAHGKAPRAIRYPTAFRTAAVGVAREHVRRGHALDRVARAIGVTAPTLTRWLRATRLPTLRPVAIIAPETRESASASTIVLTTPHGIRVDGLDAGTLVAVLRALG